MSALLAERLRQRVRLNGSAPLLTFYDLDSGERTELSATSFSNWVDKTSNLLVDEVAVAEGDVICMPLAVEAPGHWLTGGVAAGLLAGRLGGGPHESDPARGGGDGAAIGRVIAERDIFACALHPLGFGFGEPLPDGVRDYAIEVRSHRGHVLGSRHQIPMPPRGWTPSAS